MKINGPLYKGILISRPNRFVTIVDLNGKIQKSHLPDPGRLEEILMPGAEVYLVPAKKKSKRKTKYSTVMVNHNGQLISLVSTLPNRFIKEMLNKNIYFLLLVLLPSRTTIHQTLSFSLSFSLSTSLLVVSAST